MTGCGGDTVLSMMIGIRPQRKVSHDSMCSQEVNIFTIGIKTKEPILLLFVG